MKTDELAKILAELPAGAMVAVHNGRSVDEIHIQMTPEMWDWYHTTGCKRRLFKDALIWWMIIEL